MTILRDVSELNKIFRKHIIAQSRLDGEQVLNALSIHGEDLDKLFEEQVYISIERQNLLVLFELQSRPNEADVSMTNDDESIILYRSFVFRIIIYGNDSSMLANELVARFRTEKVRNAFRDDGVHIERINDPEIVNEYKNRTMWLRNDISIDIACEFNISQIDDSEIIESAAIDKIIELKEVNINV